MRAILLWMRHTWPLGPAFLLAQCATWFRYEGMTRDWSWTLSLIQGATMFGAPFIAGTCTHLVHRNWPRTTRRQMAGIDAHHRLFSDPTWAAVGWAWLAQGVFLAIGSLACLLHGADSSGLTMPWQVLTGPVAMAASAWLGTAAGLTWDSPLTVPVMVLGVFLAHQVLWDLHLPQLLSPEFATGPMSPLRPNPVHMGLSVLGNAGLIVTLIGWCRWREAPRGARPGRALVLSLLGAMVVLASCTVVAVHPAARYIFVP